MFIEQLKNLSVGAYYFEVQDQLKNHIYRHSEEAFAAGDRARDAITTPEELKLRQSLMRERFIEALGGLPSSDSPPNARVTGTIDCDGFKIEKIIFESRPGVFVTNCLYLPDGIESPKGAVLFLHGHSDIGKQRDIYQTACRYLVNAGLVVLALDPVGQGERFSYYEKSIGESIVGPSCPDHDYSGAQCLPLGDCLAKYFVHDAMRGIDYLCTRPEVDPEKIGVTGCSGGATQTTMLMVCDPRIAATAPASFLTNRKSYMYTGQAQDAEQIWPGLTALGFDHEDLLMAMAPRPVMVLAAKYDFFPIEGTRSTVGRCRRFWEMLGKGSNLEVFEDYCIHGYSRPMASTAAEFFARHLLGNTIKPTDDGVEAIDGNLLWCTSSGQVRGEIEDARFVFDENLDHLKEIESARKQIPGDERKEKALSWLRECVFTGRKLCDLNPRHDYSVQVDELTVETCFWWAQEKMLNQAFLFRDFHYAGDQIPITIAVWDGGTSSLQQHISWISETCHGGRAVMVVDLSGIGGLAPSPLNVKEPLEFYGVIHKLACDLMWIGDSLPALRTFDLLRAVEMAKIWPGLLSHDMRLCGFGRHSIYIQFASTLMDDVVGVEITDGLGSYADLVGSRHYDSRDVMSLILPGMLRYFDLPDLDRWRNGE